MKYTLFIISTIILLIITILIVQNIHINTKPIIWLYWENKPGKTMPTYLDLCIDTIKYHCNKYFQVILLNEKTVFDYLPCLRKDLNKLLIAQKTDYIRIKLLYEYGGIWLDTDTIVMRDLSPVIKKLEKYDFVGFGCTGTYCTNGYPHPSNQFLASRKKTTLFKNILNNLDNKLNQIHSHHSIRYFDLGKVTIWEEMKKLQSKQNYTYYHFDSAYDGSRMKNKRWVKPEYYFNKNIELLDENKLLVIFLSNHDIMGKKNEHLYKPFLKLNKMELVNQPYWISKMFRRSLGIKQNHNDICQKDIK